MNHGVVFLGFRRILFPHAEQGEWIITAHSRPVFVHAAAIFAVQQQANAIVVCTHLQPRHLVLVHGERHSMRVEEISRVHAQALFQTYYVIRRQRHISPLAAGVEAGNLLVAAKTELAFRGKQRRHGRTLEWNIELFIAHESKTSIRMFRQLIVAVWLAGIKPPNKWKFLEYAFIW